MEAEAQTSDVAPGSAGEALRELVAHHHGALLRTATGILRSREDAEDAVQNAYCNALRTLHNFRQEAQLKTWVVRIVVNCCLAEIRKRRARHNVDLDLARRSFASFEHDSLTPETICIEGEMRTAHVHAISQLPRRLREVYVPCAVLGSSVADTARDLGLTHAAGKSRLHRARLIVHECVRSSMERRAA